MSKNILTFGEVTEVTTDPQTQLETTTIRCLVVGVRMVGIDCQLSACCRLLPEYRPDLLGSVFDAETGHCTEIDTGKHLYTVAV